MKRITKIINELVLEFIAHQGVRTAWDINNGLCDEFAEAVIELMGGKETDRLFIATAHNFCTGLNGDTFENDKWDDKLLESHWKIHPPRGMNWERATPLIDVAHYWVIYNKRHYDAECPKGCDSFFDLPIFKNHIAHIHILA